MTNVEILLRLGAGMLIGLIVGLEREHAQRPAGMRTHILVALGSVAVTVAGEWLVTKYGSGDPLRLAAQVVSGIGFLGAGTILKEGVNIRGLTTAASLWVTACLAIVAGTGMYIAAAAGTAGILIALVVLEKVEKRMNKQHHISSALLEVVAAESSGFDETVAVLIEKYSVEPRGISIENTDSGKKIEIRLRARSRTILGELLIEVSSSPGVKRAQLYHVDE